MTLHPTVNLKQNHNITIVSLLFKNNIVYVILLTGEVMKTDKSILFKLYKILSKKQKINFLIITIIMIVSAILSQLIPISIGFLTDDILATDQLLFKEIIPFLLFILIVTVTNEVIKVIRRLIVEDTCTRCEKTARINAITGLLYAPLSYFKKNMTGNIHGRLNRSLEGTIRLLKLIFMDFAPAIFTAIAALVVIFTKLPLNLALIILLVIPIGIIIVLRQIKTQKGIKIELLEEKSNMDGTTVELINGIEVIRVTDSNSQEISNFSNKSEYLRTKEMKHHKAMALYDCLKFVNEAVFTVITIGISAYLAGRGVISVGTVLTSYLCFTQLTTPLRELHRILDELSESIILAKEYFKIAELPKDFSYNQLAIKSNEDSKYIIDIKNLSFSYDEGKEVISNLNLKIKKGQFIGLAGPSGCGKSSLIKIITKLEKATGEILIENKNILNYKRSELAQIISLVPQSPFIIAGTVKENICYGIKRNVTDEEIKEAAKRAHIEKFINALPEKYETKIAEGGTNLSGGQRQRIAIARIFLSKPKILILDEATSALDNTSEKYIQKEIEKFQKENNITILSIAHRLTTLENCDQIIVMDKGKIIQKDTYKILIKEEGIFHDMYKGILK